ncbi:MAG: DUF2946 domain-containing protein [Burkholderiales bacterium]|nr:DUF2946 domain-containing protein [Burkholderiales bacterium]MCA3156924.1 DUF2946 domain-containing protein [Burkholderiales bacterium]MCA3168679.1 DUF2946 domain-containing protein [Burkholderiales bacterium]
MRKAGLRTQGLRQRLAAWLALFALCLHALAPSLSHAAAYGSGKNAWIEICSSAGSLWLKADPAHTGVDTSIQHCPYCSQASHAPVVPTSSLSWLPPTPRSFLVSFIPQPSPASVIWPSARARAPPLQS